MRPPRERTVIEATDAERSYSVEQAAAERATALAIRANHPSTYHRSGVSDRPPVDATPEEGTGLAAADPVPAPTLSDFHPTVSAICDAAQRLRLLKGGRDG